MTRTRFKLESHVALSLYPSSCPSSRSKDFIVCTSVYHVRCLSDQKSTNLSCRMCLKAQQLQNQASSISLGGHSKFKFVHSQYITSRVLSQIDFPSKSDQDQKRKHSRTRFTKISYMLKGTRSINTFINIPTHCRPSPEYPWLQLQINEPPVLLQEASEWQSWALSLHSLISVVTGKMQSTLCFL